MTIDHVIEEFLALQRALLNDEDYAMVRSVIRFFKLSANGHAPLKFDEDEKAYWQQFLVPGQGYRTCMSRHFGADKLPREVKYFFCHFLVRHAHVSAHFMRRAPGVLYELFEWMVRERHIPELDIETLFPKTIRARCEASEWPEIAQTV